MADAPTLPFPSSQCHGCAHKRDVKTGRSWFLRCTGTLRKYPPQPVFSCAAFVSQAADPVSNGADDAEPIE
jgi:hypothetical protein